MRLALAQHKKRRHERGFVLIAGSLVLLVCMLFLGLAFDTGYVQYQKRRMQTAADAASVGASVEKQSGSDSSTSITAGKADSALNGFTDGTNGVSITISNPPSTGNYTTDTTAWEAIVSQSQPTYFMKLMGLDSVMVKARSVARASGPGDGCIYALNSSTGDALKITGGTTITAKCGVYVNSNNSTAMSINGSGTCLQATKYEIGGDYHDAGCALSPAPDTNRGANQVSDPLSWVSPPSFTAGHCDYTNWTNVSLTLNPGTYCGGITITSGLLATFNPGTYVLYGGGMNVSGNSNLVGTGVTFYNTQGTGYSYKPFSITGGALTALTAPTSGSLAGILFYKDPSVSSGQTETIAGNSASIFQGSIYLKGAPLLYSGGSAGAAYTVLVADTIQISGGSVLNDDFSSLLNGSPVRSGPPQFLE